LGGDPRNKKQGWNAGNSGKKVLGTKKKTQKKKMKRWGSRHQRISEKKEEGGEERGGRARDAGTAKRQATKSGIWHIINGVGVKKGQRGWALNTSTCGKPKR